MTDTSRFDTVPLERTALLAEFADARSMARAVRICRARDVGPLHAYSAGPAPEVADALEDRRRIAPSTLAGGLVGLAAGFGVATYASVVAYPIEVAGTDQAAWPAFVVPAFEVMILVAALSTFVAFLARCGLPRLVHPVFAAAAPSAGTGEDYLLVVETGGGVRRKDVFDLLLESGALRIEEVSWR